MAGMPETVENEPASVYAFELEDNTVKIGMSGNIAERIKGVEYETHLKVISVFSLKVETRKKAFTIEAALHKHFAEQCKQGEFFTVDFSEVCKKISNLVGDISTRDFSIADRFLKIAELTTDSTLREKSLNAAYTLLEI